MSRFTHKVENGIEEYAMTSALNPTLRHYVEREEGGPWEINAVGLDQGLSLAEARTLRSEIDTLIEFMEQLIPAELHRRTGPGQPELAGIGGGL